MTTALLRALEPQTSTEEAEFAALNNAGVLALLVSSEPIRLVLAAEVESEQITATEDAAGEVALSSLSWAQVQALFVLSRRPPKQRRKRGSRSRSVPRGHTGGGAAAARDRPIAAGLRSAVVRTR